MLKFTDPISPTEIFRSQYGDVTGEQWCKKEVERCRRNGIYAEIRETHKGKIYLVRGSSMPRVALP